MPKHDLPKDFQPAILERGITAAGRNSKDLLEAAELLHQNGHHGAAAALATLSLEEYAKKIILTAVHAGYPTPERELKRLLAGAHEAKLAIAWQAFAALTPGKPYPQLEQRVNELSKLTQAAKLRGFYVDLARGSWHTPQDPELQELAERLLPATREIQAALDPLLERLLSKAEKDGQNA